MMFDLSAVQQIDGGWHVKVRDDGEFCIDVMQMLYSYRIVISPTEPQHMLIEHGWCYFGHGVDAEQKPRSMHGAMLAAMTAACAWDGYGVPPGFDKQAC
jgi:hypothetical protein